MATKLLRYKYFLFADLWEMLLKMREMLDANLKAMIFWFIWSRRNLARVGEHFIEVQQIRKRVVAYLYDFQQVQCSKVHQSLLSERAVRRIPPTYPLYKVNFDGVTFKKLGVVGFGVVVRDHTGNVIGALAERIQLPSSPAVVEALACRRRY